MMKKRLIEDLGEINDGFHRISAACFRTSSVFQKTTAVLSLATLVKTKEKSVPIKPVILSQPESVAKLYSTLQRIPHDEISALKFVRETIDEFIKDPKKYTLSAGADEMDVEYVRNVILKNNCLPVTFIRQSWIYDIVCTVGLTLHNHIYIDIRKRYLTRTGSYHTKNGITIFLNAKKKLEDVLLRAAKILEEAKHIAELKHQRRKAERLKNTILSETVEQKNIQNQT